MKRPFSRKASMQKIRITYTSGQVLTIKARGFEVINWPDGSLRRVAWTESNVRHLDMGGAIAVEVGRR